MGIGSYWRLARAGFILSREGAFSLVAVDHLPATGRLAIRLLRSIERRSVKKTGRVERLSRALNRLGPTYVKFGQTLATRPDIVGADIASDLSTLHDAMDPFPQSLVAGILAQSLGERAKDIVDISEPVAAASIAQVHKCRIRRTDGSMGDVAVKLLRPGIETRFGKDIESFYAGARLAERLVPAIRRLRPLDMVKVLDRSARLELDLRFEAASISEFSENTKDDPGFRVPEVDWEHTGRRVLTTSWMEGIPVHDLERLDAAGIDRKKVSANLMQSFLRHAIRDGLFHADMHPGNLFADPETGGVLAVDFGIMGRIDAREQRFLAEILYGFIKRNYQRVAQLHFDIGYVPENQSIKDFALALRMIGEPLHGHIARDISMAEVFSQLLAVTDLFEMKARPELILLQKNMALVEGVGRMLDPEMDIWKLAEPVVGGWIRQQAGPKGIAERIREEAREGITALKLLPEMVINANRLIVAQQEEAKIRQETATRRFRMVFSALLLAAALLIWRLW